MVPIFQEFLMVHIFKVMLTIDILQNSLNYYQLINKLSLSCIDLLENSSIQIIIIIMHQHQNHFYKNLEKSISFIKIFIKNFLRFEKVR